MTLYKGESLFYSDVLSGVAVVDRRVPNVAFSRPRRSFVGRVPLELSQTNRALMLHLLIIFRTKSVVFKIKKAFDNLLKIHMLCAGQ